MRGGGTSDDDGVSVTTLADGTAYVGGSFSGTLTMGTTSVTATAYTDAFLAKFSANGALLWLVRGGGSSDDEVAEVSAVPDGSGIYMTGTFGYSTSVWGHHTDVERSRRRRLGHLSGEVQRERHGPVGQVQIAVGDAQDEVTSVATDSSGAAYVAFFFDDYPIHRDT